MKILPAMRARVYASLSVAPITAFESEVVAISCAIKERKEGERRRREKREEREEKGRGYHQQP
jgi:hypothetical protein